MVKDKLFLAKNRKKARKMGYMMGAFWLWICSKQQNLFGIAEVCYKSIEHITTQYFSFGIEIIISIYIKHISRRCYNANNTSDD